MTKPKLLQLCAVDFTAYHFLLPLARGLRDHFDVHFVSSDGPYVERVEAEGFLYHRLPVSRSYNFLSHVRALVQLHRLMVSQQYQVVHVHTPIAALIGRIAARMAGVPVKVYTAHGFYFHDRMSRVKRRAFVELERLGRWFTEYTFTQSDEDRLSAIELGIAPASRILHIGNGIDLARFNPRRLRPLRDSIRTELGVPLKQPVVCMVGRLVREKGYFELISAFAEVVKRVPDAVLIAVGGALVSDHDDAADEIFAAVQHAGIEKHVRFLSFRDDVERVLCASDVFVLPSHREGMPRSLIEAMAMGLPVVSTNIRGSREAVDPGTTGTLVAVGDVHALAEALVEQLQDEEVRVRYGKSAQAVARERFDESRIVKRQVDVIRGLLRRTLPPLQKTSVSR